MSKINELLDKKIDLKPFFAGPFTAIYDTFLNLFNRRKETTYGPKNFIYDIRQGNPVSIRSEKILNQYESMYGSKIDSKFALDTIKMGMKREICDEIMRSDLFEWQFDETAMGTRVAARIIVNKFEK
jgi:hypothetical protein